MQYRDPYRQDKENSAIANRLDISSQSTQSNVRTRFTKVFGDLDEHAPKRVQSVSKKRMVSLGDFSVPVRSKVDSSAPVPLSPRKLRRELLMVQYELLELKKRFEKARRLHDLEKQAKDLEGSLKLEEKELRGLRRLLTVKEGKGQSVLKRKSAH